MKTRYLTAQLSRVATLILIASLSTVSYTHAESDSPPQPIEDTQIGAVSKMNCDLEIAKAIKNLDQTDFGALGKLPNFEDAKKDVLARDAKFLTNHPEPVNGGLDPNHVRSDSEIRHLIAKEREVDLRIRCAKKNIDTPKNAIEGFYSSSVSVGYYKEPDSVAYKNYCGPASYQVAVSARLPNGVPSLSQAAIDVGFNGTTTYMTSIGNALNSKLNTSWYEVNGSTNSTVFTNRLMIDLNNRYAMVTGVKTGALSGWGGYNTNHIVTAYAFYAPDILYVSQGYIYYTDTAGAGAGYSGSYWQSYATIGNFYNYAVSGLDTQAW